MTLDYLLSPHAVRDSSQKMFRWLEAGSTHFEFHASKLPALADYVVQVTRDNYPDLKIPYHSRWKHFWAGGAERVDTFYRTTFEWDPERRCRSEVDLVVLSVLLDAGAGMRWSYKDPFSKQEIGKSEGLALASFDAFMAGRFSRDPNRRPWRVDAERLITINESELREIFQVSDSNPLEGLSGRCRLLQSLGHLMNNPLSGFAGGRPSALITHWKRSLEGKRLSASNLLKGLLQLMGPIWPSRLEYNGKPLGDVWHYAPWGEKDNPESYVAFHKLSQWLSFSLIDPLEKLGWEIAEIDKLSGLAEYRNGGLFVDSGVLTLKDPSLYDKKHLPGSELIIEWRALTLASLDLLAAQVRERLRLPQLSLPKILEGGTWWAGRKIASHKRADSSPPIQIESDGTVF